MQTFVPTGSKMSHGWRKLPGYVSLFVEAH